MDKLEVKLEECTEETVWPWEKITHETNEDVLVWCLYVEGTVDGNTLNDLSSDRWESWTVDTQIKEAMVSGN
jgi:hypothetical protein